MLHVTGMGYHNFSLPYDEDGKRPRGSFKPKPYLEQDACGLYMIHFGNWLYLKFVADHPKATFLEKQEARKQLEIAERKMHHWEKHPNYDLSIVQPRKDLVVRQWATQQQR